MQNGSIVKYFILIGFIFIVISFFYCFVIAKKRRVSKEDLVLNNEFIKNKRGELEKIIDENNDLRESYMKKVKPFFILTILLIILFIYLNIVTVNGIFFTGIFFIALTVTPIVVCYSKYNMEFKDNIVPKIIKKYNENLEYAQENGFTKAEYNICRFPEDCDIFSSEDLIYDKTTSFRYADILVESEHKDGDDNTVTITEYQGSLARINIKDFHCEIFLGDMQRGIFFNEYQKIKFENDEFNSLFKAYTNNELIAYKLLTPDVMEQFVHLKKNTYGDVEIRIINDRLYIRFLSGDGYVPNLFSKQREVESIISSIAVLDEVINTMNNVHSIIEKKDL